MRNRNLEAASAITAATLILSACAPINANPNTSQPTPYAQTGGEPPYPVPGIPSIENLNPALGICGVENNFAQTAIQIRGDLESSNLRSDVEATVSTINTLLKRINYCYIWETPELGMLATIFEPAPNLLIEGTTDADQSVLETGISETTAYITSVDSNSNAIALEAQVPTGNVYLSSRTDAIFTTAYLYYLAAVKNGADFEGTPIVQEWLARQFAATTTVIISERLNFPIEGKTISENFSQELYDTLTSPSR